MDLPHYPLTDLVAIGDLACEQQQAGPLSDAARQLAPCVEESVRVELERIARLAGEDLRQASVAWQAVVEDLLKHGVVGGHGREPLIIEASAR
jgi:hypothetical protein